MTPEEIERTIDFILRSHADSVIRMDRLEEAQVRFEESLDKTDKRFQLRHENLQEQIDLLAAAARDLVKVGRRHEASIARIDKAIVTLTRLADGHSKRIARLEGKGR